MNVDVKKAMYFEVGLKRNTPPRLESIERGYNFFCDVANQMLKVKKKTFDASKVKNVIKMALDWLYMMNRYSSDYHKGLLIKGHTGRGKTFLFRILAFIVLHEKRSAQEKGFRVRIESFNIVNVKQISGEYQNPDTGGDRIIQKYGELRGLVLDDIGKEPEFSSYYGNKINVVEEIIDLREKKGLITHGTTNLELMGDVYDDRTVSRMNALFNVIPLNHEVDYRLR